MGDLAFRLLTLDSITTDSQHAGTTNCGLATPSYIGNLRPSDSFVHREPMGDQT